MYPMKITNQSLNGFTLDAVRFLRADLNKRQALKVLIEAKPHMLDASVISANWPEVCINTSVYEDIHLRLR